MSELVFLKLGGSLITDKLRREMPRPDVIGRLAAEVRSALDERPDLRIVLGHGSGSFGHFAAERYQVHRGHLQDWRGYAETGAVAQRLNRLVTDAFLAAGVPAVSLQPSASARCRGGELVELAAEPVRRLIQHGAVPLVYGDVALDDVQGCAIISTEQVMIHLARALRPQRILLAGQVEGVFSADPRHDPTAQLIPAIAARHEDEIAPALTGSHGVDVTGGMLSKVRLLCALIREQPELTVRILTGERAGVVQAALTNATLTDGTCLRY